MDYNFGQWNFYALDHSDFIVKEGYIGIHYTKVEWLSVNCNEIKLEYLILGLDDVRKEKGV